MKMGCMRKVHCGVEYKEAYMGLAVGCEQGERMDTFMLVVFVFVADGWMLAHLRGNQLLSFAKLVAGRTQHR